MNRNSDARMVFMDMFGGVYENSPWIAEQVFEASDGSRLTLDELVDAFRDVVLSARLEQQLDLLNAHPQLACAPADREALTRESSEEQSGAGLDQCTEEEYAAFAQLNQLYLERFGFPFIMAVKGFHRTEILEAFRERVDNEPEQEFAEALSQVCRIARHRLEVILEGQAGA